MSLILRWQIGPHGTVSWRALSISIRLMRRLEPRALCFVAYQGECRERLEGVRYIHQDDSLYSHGHFHYPQFQGMNAHVVVLENDHIMWALPPAWERWRARKDAVLAWIVDWDYYGNYAERVGDFRACPGMYGLPPGKVMPLPPADERGDDQAEQGFVASWLREHPPHELVTHDEVTAYMPNHDILRHTHSKVGTHGVHLPGLNRGWSAGGEALLGEIERRWL